MQSLTGDVICNVYSLMWVYHVIICFHGLVTSHYFRVDSLTYIISHVIWVV